MRMRRCHIMQLAREMQQMENRRNGRERKCLDVNTVDSQSGTKRKRFFKRLQSLFSTTLK